MKAIVLKPISYQFSRSTIALIICITLFSGCLGPKLINKWVAKQYDGTVQQKPSKQTDYLVIKSPLATAGGAISETEKNTSHLLPLLFYWQFDYANTCTLNAQIPINNFTATVIKYAAGKGLKQKLNGQKIELSVDSLPNSFVIDDKGHIVWVIYAFSWDIISIVPQKRDMVVSYSVTQNGAVTKTGTITVQDMNTKIPLGMFQSLQKKTGGYLDQYDANITAMSRKVVDKLMQEL